MFEPLWHAHVHPPTPPTSPALAAQRHIHALPHFRLHLGGWMACCTGARLPLLCSCGVVAVAGVPVSVRGCICLPSLHLLCSPGHARRRATHTSHTQTPYHPVHRRCSRACSSSRCPRRWARPCPTPCRTWTTSRPSSPLVSCLNDHRLCARFQPENALALRVCWGTQAAGHVLSGAASPEHTSALPRSGAPDGNTLHKHQWL